MMVSNFSKLGSAAVIRVGCYRSRWLIAAALTLTCASIVLVVRAYSSSSSESRITTVSELPKAPAPRASLGGVQSAPRELVTTVRFNLFDLGIYPREVHVKHGVLAVTIEDYSGGTTGLVVERETGSAPERVGAVQRERPSSSRGQNQMRLGPGRYQVYMADHPDNRALLVVEP
ncbi:MAG TPA: hypothetical protein VFB82_18055 [Blastocatellia bacterium]|nr:hypothetical protein [Blastocatellia bacterium]